MDKNEIKKIAELARLEFTDIELKKLIPDLNSILVFVDKLKEVKAKNVEVTHQIALIKNVLRKDNVTRDHEFSEKLLKLAPKKENNSIAVRAILEDKND